MTDPFRVTGPACLSFSGGRSSAMLLYRVLEAHGGTLPEDVWVVFANTGKEFPQTLDFVQACSTQWSVPITWIEYDGAGLDERTVRATEPVDAQRFPGRTADRSYRVVDHATASRHGEPFARLITQDRYLPNPAQRKCTQHLKVEAIHAFLRAQGEEAWTAIIGFRADERHRIAKARANEEPHESKVFPLAVAGVTKADVLAFWKAQPFDLALRWWESNCTLCFMKGRAIRLRIMQDHPDEAAFWIEQERSVGARFCKDGPDYRKLDTFARNQRSLPMLLDPPEHEALADCACTD